MHVVVWHVTIRAEGLPVSETLPSAASAAFARIMAEPTLFRAVLAARVAPLLGEPGRDPRPAPIT